MVVLLKGSRLNYKLCKYTTIIYTVWDYLYEYHYNTYVVLDTSDSSFKH